MKDILMLVDGNSIFHRAYFALPAMNDKNGRNVNAVYGFVNILVKVLAEYDPAYIAVAFDTKGKTFRHDLFADYKANRKGMPDDLAVQLPILQELLRVMNIAIVQKSGVEADDVIGTLAKRFGTEKFLLSGDRDLLQLIDEKTTVLLTKKGVSEVERVDERALKENYGMKPFQVIEYKALRGDASDNIPGVKGVGEVTAKALIAEYGGIDAVYANLDGIKGTLKEKLIENRDMAYLSKKLATIDIGVDCACSIDECRRKPFTPALRDKFLELEFRSLVKRLNFEDAAQAPAQTDKTAPSSVKIEGAEQLKKLVEKLQNAKCVSVCFGKDATFFDGETLYSAAISDNFLEGMGFADILGIVKPFLESGVEKCVYDSKAMKHMLLESGIALYGVKWDVSVMQYLVEYRTYKSFESLAENYSAPADAFGLSCVMDSLKQSLANTGTEKLYFDIELPLVDILFDMETEGVKVDTEFLDTLHGQYVREIKELSEQVYALAGEKFNILSPKQLAAVLFDKLMLPHFRKTKTGYSTDNEVLEKIMDAHPIVPLIVKIRRVSKLNGTYVEGIKPLVKRGLLHTTYNQTLTATGRLSSSEPNLQNIPIRNDQGRELRKMFLPKYDMLISADYSQIELRLLAHFSGDANLIAAFNSGKDIHTEVAAEIFSVPPEMVTANMRRTAKAVNFGIIYGISDFGLSENVGITTAKARSYIKKYFEKYPTIKAYLDSSVVLAKETGFVTTIAGRRRMIPELKSSNYQLRMFGERAAMNMPLQGSSADIIKIAMIRVAKRLEEKNFKSKLIMQVHDELIVDAFESESAEVEKILKDEMENAVSLRVKLTVNIEKGGNLYESK